MAYSSARIAPSLKSMPTTIHRSIVGPYRRTPRQAVEPPHNRRQIGIQSCSGGRRRASRERPPGPPKLVAGVEQRLHLDQVARSEPLRERREASAKVFEGTTVLLGSAIELRQAQRGS